jgi:hypothetical protein
MLASRDIGGSVSFTIDGVNGDLAFNVLQRLGPVIGLAPDAVSVQVGTQRHQRQPVRRRTSE